MCGGNNDVCWIQESSNLLKPNQKILVKKSRVTAGGEKHYMGKKNAAGIKPHSRGNRQRQSDNYSKPRSCPFANIQKYRKQQVKLHNRHNKIKMVNQVSGSYIYEKFIPIKDKEASIDKVKIVNNHPKNIRQIYLPESVKKKRTIF